MREFHRPPVPCKTCKARIYSLWSAGEFDDNFVEAKWTEPPGVVEKCPRCGALVDTTSAYPAISSFPMDFRGLKNAYGDFSPVWEHNRQSFEKCIHEMLENGCVRTLEAELNSQDGTRRFKQRLFYRSCAAFYRALQLFLGFLTLEKHCFTTWAKVTGYYSRFFFIQAFLNLTLSSWLSLDRLFIFYDGAKVNCLPKKNLAKILREAGSHEIWWGLMEAVKQPDYPVTELGFVLTKLVFNPQSRQRVNYDFEYQSGGFIELDWFDSGARQMLAQMMPHPRPDQDSTDIDRFFGAQDPENCDVGDFYGDDAQIIWCSLIGYLELVKALQFPQTFLKTENVAALAEVHLRREYPNLLEGIVRSVAACLGDGFDVESFLKRRVSNPDELSQFRF